jgi:hypothetical protein
MKKAYIEGTFPELPSGKMYKVGRGTGGNAKVAISRAFSDLLKQVKGRRITAIKATISLSEVVVCDMCGKELCECGESS